MPSMLHTVLRRAAAELRPHDTRLWGVVGPLTRLHDGDEGTCRVCRESLPCATLRAIADGLEVSAHAA